MMKLLPLIPKNRPLLLLAPMQDVTDLSFWHVLHKYGGPDVYFTEYLRVHRDSTPEKYIVGAIRNHTTGRPAIVQMIGEHIPALVRTARFLEKLPVAAIDLNMGCPAPIVCKKSAGGGLLRQLDHVREILKALCETISIGFTVKTRIGFESPDEFDAILEVFADFPLDGLTIHGRTVKEMYRSHVHYDRIATAVARLPYPVFANGSILSPETAWEVTRSTQAAGLMIGRGCIRNPWIFSQIDARFTGREVYVPTLRDALGYVALLYENTAVPHLAEKFRVSRMKKYMAFITQGMSEEFWLELRTATTEKDFFTVCTRYLDSTEPFQPEPGMRHLRNSGNPRLECYA